MHRSTAIRDSAIPNGPAARRPIPSAIPSFASAPAPAQERRAGLPLRAALAFGALALTGALGTAPALADVLLIDRVEESRSQPLPARGSSMSQVESRFGTPTEKRAPVGGSQPQWPPITRWIYPEFSVYFENDRVVDTVVNQASPLETGPKPVR